jgi:AraC family transcriptional regulator
MYHLAPSGHLLAPKKNRKNCQAPHSQFAIIAEMNMRTRPATLRFYKERLLRVLVHIQQHLDEQLPLAELASLACLSPYHFHHVFTGMTGESLASHIRRLRLERAAGRLKLTTNSVVEIAFEAGYETHESFTRAFHLAFGMSPAQFRRRKGMSALPGIPSGVHYRDRESLKSFRTVKAKGQDMNVTGKHLMPMRVAFMRHIGPYHEVGTTWDRFMMLMGKDGWLGSGSQFIGLCHDDPAVTPPDKVRYDACATVDAKFRAQGEIGVQVIAGGDYAVTTHFGPYTNLGSSFAKLLGQCLPRSGRFLRSVPCLEMYLNSPESTEPEDLVTDIYAPLEPK